MKRGSFSSTGRGFSPLLYGASASWESQDAPTPPFSPSKKKALEKQEDPVTQPQGLLSVFPKPKLFPWSLYG